MATAGLLMKRKIGMRSNLKKVFIGSPSSSLVSPLFVYVLVDG